MSNSTVPQFPGKGGAAQPGKPGPTQPVPGWKKAICPILTSGEIARHQASVIVTPGVQPGPMQAQACLGPDCMLFITTRNADGSETAGCAVVHQVLLLGALHRNVDRFIQAAEAGAAAEAAASALSMPAEPPPASPAVPPALTLIPEPSPLTAAAEAAADDLAPKGTP